MVRYLVILLRKKIKKSKPRVKAKPYYKAWNTRHVGWNQLNGHGNGAQVVVRRKGKKYHAFVGHMKDMGTSILDVTVPDEPELIAQLPIPPNTHSHKVRVVGDVMMVNYERRGEGKPPNSGLKFFDISKIDAPRDLSIFRTVEKGVHRFWVDDKKSLAYLSAAVDGFVGNIFLTVDFSDPRNPKEVSRWWLPGQWAAGGEKPDWNPMDWYWNHLPIVVNGRAFLSYWDGGFIILDMSTLEKPRMVGRANHHPPYPGSTHTALPLARKIMNRDWLIVFDEALATAAEHKYAWVYDVTDVSNPVPVSTFPVDEEEFRNRGGRCGPHQPFEDPTARDDLIYGAWTNCGLRVVSIRNPYQPKEVGYYVPRTLRKDQPVATNDAFVDDRDLIYIIDRYGRGLDIVEYKGPR